MSKEFNRNKNNDRPTKSPYRGNTNRSAANNTSSSNRQKGFRAADKPVDESRPVRKSYSEESKPTRSYGETNKGSEKPFKPSKFESKAGNKNNFAKSSKTWDNERPVKKYSDRPSSDDQQTKPDAYKGKANSWFKKSNDLNSESTNSSDRAVRKNWDSGRPVQKYDNKGSKYSPENFRKSKDRFAENENTKPKRARISTAKKAPAEESDLQFGSVRLNKYIANAGICSRREADVLIETGAITVNGKIVSELGYKVSATDIVAYGGQGIRREKNVYLLLNKPKDYITTADDPLERKTVMHLIKGACKERVYPVGRLDRNSTGLLILTNDGELTKKLTHPRYEKKKIYHIELDRPLKKEDMHKILEGVELEDGMVHVDEISYVTGASSKKEVGIELHSGKNRVIRRIFEHLNYEVKKLDRVFFAGLSKKDLPRGKWRFLTDREVAMLNAR